MDRRMAACLTMLAVSGLLGCADTPVQVAAPDVSAAVAGTDSVALTYICGNMFRIRNSSFEPRSVRWDIYNASPADTGSLWARGRDVGRTSVDFFVTARTKGTMRLFVGTTLVATKANGNKVACAAPADTSPFPSKRERGRLDMTKEPVFRDASDSTTSARTIVYLTFKPEAAATQKREFQRRFFAQLITVSRSFLQFRVPDPGNTRDAVDSLIARIRNDAAVSEAEYVTLLGPVKIDEAIYPSDGSNLKRSDYLNADFETWAARALRLPQAWWCENGMYGSSSVRVAVLEHNFASPPADLLPSLSAPVRRFTFRFDSSASPPNAAQRDSLERHGIAVAGILGSAGGNGLGVAGVIWKTDLRLISLETVSSEGIQADLFARSVVPELVALQPRVLSLSSDFGLFEKLSRYAFNLRAASDGIAELLDSLPGLLIVQAAGNDGVVGSPESIPVSRRTVLQQALLSLKASGVPYSSQIIHVGSTTQSGNRAGRSNTLSGSLDVYAPGERVTSLAVDGTPREVSGTSFAAPLVAGVAAQLLAVDPSLTAADVKQLILAGATDSVENSSGVNVAPSKVGNTSDDVYEADAFGSLRVLSGMRPGTPICDPSFAYWKESASQPTGPKGWRAIRYGGALDDRFDQPGMPGRESGYSLAPGGRLLATGVGLQASRAGGVRLRRLFGGVSTDSTTVGNWDLMQFGEKDVLYARGVGGVADTVPDVEYLISGPGRPTTPRRAFSNTAQRVVRIAMRPDGEGVAVVSERNQELFLMLVDASGSSSAPVSLAAPSVTPQIVHSDIFWRPDSKGLVVTQSARDTPVSTSNAWGTNAKYFEVSGSGAPTFKANVATSGPIGQVVTGRWGSGGVRFDLVGFRELVSSECNTFASRASSTVAAFSTAAVDHNEYCGENRLVPPDPGGGGCSDLCENGCCFGIFRINKKNFPIARIRADSQAGRVNY